MSTKKIISTFFLIIERIGLNGSLFSKQRMKLIHMLGVIFISNFLYSQSTSKVDSLETYILETVYNNDTTQIASTIYCNKNYFSIINNEEYVISKSKRSSGMKPPSLYLGYITNYNTDTTYFLKKENDKYVYYAFSRSGEKPKFSQKSKIKKEKETKEILGYSCKKATIIDKTETNLEPIIDTVVVYYYELPDFEIRKGLNGLVLETISPWNHIKTKSITKQLLPDYFFSPPNKYERVPNFEEMINRRNTSN